MIKTKKIFKLDNLIFSMLWLLIVLPKSAQLVLIYLFALFLFRQRGVIIKHDKVALAMWLLSAVHLFAIIYNVMFLHTSGIDRLFAAINTLALWIIVPLYYVYYRYYYKYDIEAVGKSCSFNLIVLGLLAILACYLYYLKGYGEYSIGSNVLYDTTYLDGVAEMKFFGLNDFSNMNLFFIMLMLGLAVPYLFKKNIIYRLFIIAVATFCVLCIHSRAGYVLFFISLAYCLCLRAFKRYRAIFLCLVSVFALDFLLLFGERIFGLLLNKIILGNTNSNNFRIELLSTSISEAWSMSPLWGMGIKRYLVEGYPLGSHSTYVGFFYKTGILGAIIGLYCFYKANIRVLLKNRKSVETFFISIFLLCFIVLFAIEDVDAADWSIILYFSTLGIFSCKNLIQNKKAISYGDGKYRLTSYIAAN